MVEHLPVWAILLGIIYAIGALATLQHLLHVGRRTWDRRAFQVAASIAWPVYWIALPAIAPRDPSLPTGASQYSGALLALFKSIVVRIATFVGGVLAIGFCAAAALAALIVAVFMPARRVAAVRDYWLGPIEPTAQDQEFDELPLSYAPAFPEPR